MMSNYLECVAGIENFFIEKRLSVTGAGWSAAGLSTFLGFLTKEQQKIKDELWNTLTITRDGRGDLDASQAKCFFEKLKDLDAWIQAKMSHHHSRELYLAALPDDTNQQGILETEASRLVRGLCQDAAERPVSTGTIGHLPQKRRVFLFFEEQFSVATEEDSVMAEDNSMDVDSVCSKDSMDVDSVCSQDSMDVDSAFSSDPSQGVRRSGSW